MDKRKSYNQLWFDSISGINDEWIEQAVDYKRNKSVIIFPILRYVNMAAALLICVISLSLYFRIQPVNEINPELIELVNQTTAPEPQLSDSPTVAPSIYSNEDVELITATPSEDKVDSLITHKPELITDTPLYTDIPIRTKEPVYPLKPTGAPVVRTAEPTEIPSYNTEVPVVSTESVTSKPTKEPVYFTEEPPVIITKSPEPTPYVTPVWTRIPTQAPIVRTPTPKPTKQPNESPSNTPSISRIPTYAPSSTPNQYPSMPTLTSTPSGEYPGAEAPTSEPTASPSPTPTCTPSPEPTWTPIPDVDVQSYKEDVNNISLYGDYRFEGPIFLSKYLIKEVSVKIFN